MADIKLKKIPYGISDYRMMVEKNYIYVDKTKHIELLESLGERYIFLLRPRRFGKSLFTTTLEHYYDTNYEKDFEKLFGNTYIGKNPTDEKNSFHVLKFNFSGIDTSSKENLIKGFTTNVLNSLKLFDNRNKLGIELKNGGMPSEIFSTFLVDVKEKIKLPIYVIIDEYDHFANELLSFQTDVFEETISKTGFVRKWYEVLKNGTDNGLIQRIFITGVSPVTMDSLTSGFNIAKNKTRDVRFNECMGFTEEEVKSILKDTLGDSIDINLEMPLLRKYYNGYLFSEDSKHRIFNSDMVLYYISEFSATNSRPKQLIDINVSSDYKKIASLFSLKNKEQNYAVLNKIIEGEPQKTIITPEFSLAKEFTKDDFCSLLFYLGFLTIGKSGLVSVELIAPNYVIKELYFDFFGEILRAKANYDIDVSRIRDSIEEIAVNADIKSFIEIVCTTLNKLSNNDYQRFDEKYIKIIMTTYLMMSRIYYVKSEYPAGGGYIDIALLPRPGVNAPYNAIIELKYIKKEDCSPQLIAQKAHEAKKQIEKYSEADELAQMNNLLKWVLVFCKDELVYEEKIPM